SYKAEKEWLLSISEFSEPVRFFNQSKKFLDVTAETDGIVRLEKIYKNGCDNSVSFAIADFEAPDSMHALLEFTMADMGLLFLNRQNLMVDGSEDGLISGNFVLKRCVYLKKGLNRIAVKLENRKRGYGIALRIRPASEADIKARVVTDLSTDTASARANNEYRDFLKLNWPSKSKFAAVAGAQDSLHQVMEFLRLMVMDRFRISELVERNRNAFAFTVLVQSLKQAAHLVNSGKNPFPAMKGAVEWGYFSILTNSVVPFHAFIPDGIPADSVRPLFTGLHGRDGESFSFLRQLAMDSDLRGSFVLSPTGRGNLGYRGPGECDVVDLIAFMRKNHPVDSERIIITGASMGGWGTFRMVSRHKSLFSAALPQCGFFRTPETDNYKGFPIWAFHGSEDKVVHYNYLLSADYLFGGNNGLFKKTTIAGAGHNLSKAAIYTDSVVAWLLSFKKSTRKVSKEVSFDGAFDSLLFEPTIFVYDDKAGASTSRLKMLALKAAAMDNGGFPVVPLSKLSAVVAKEKNLFLFILSSSKPKIDGKEVSLPAISYGASSAMLFLSRHPLSNQKRLMVLSQNSGRNMALESSLNLEHFLLQPFSLVRYDSQFVITGVDRLDSNFTVIPPRPAIKLKAASVSEFADTVLSKICIAEGKSRGILLLPESFVLESGTVTDRDIERFFEVSSPIVLSLSGVEIKKLLAERKIMYRKLISLLYFKGCDEKTLLDETRYEFVTASYSIQPFANARFVAASAKPITELFIPQQ
ncbi:MAG: prolyl oligopeptidase family serine peptidase, partial [Fibrobacteres bacterium]|nr:prolyl oligopeptidase family serine peptidase [Fibrobacterota bacterium]